MVNTEETVKTVKIKEKTESNQMFVLPVYSTTC